METMIWIYHFKILILGLRDDPVTKSLTSQCTELWFFPSSGNQTLHAVAKSLYVTTKEPENYKDDWRSYLPQRRARAAE